MAVSYKKIWKLLIDKDMKKKDLCAKAGDQSRIYYQDGPEWPRYYRDPPKNLYGFGLPN